MKDPSKRKLIDRLLEGKRPYYLILSLGIFVYFWTIFFGFSYLDDSVLILDNIYFLKNLGNIFNIFTMEVFHVLHASASYYRPILTLTFMIDSQFAGSSPFFYHFSNLIIHLVSSCLLYVFLLKINIKKDLALLFAVIFSVHPALSQAVSWIPGRNDSLLTLFFLAAFIFYIRFTENSKSKDLIWHFVFFFLAIFSKESAVFIPFFALGYSLFILKKKVPNLWMVVSGWASIGIFWLILRSIALGQNPTVYTLNFIFRSLLVNFPAVLLYIGKSLFPVNLSVLPILQDSNLLYGAAASLLILLLLIFSKNKNYLKIAFGICFFFAFLLSSFIRPNTDYVSDFLEHRLYLPIIGLFIVLSEVSFIKNINLKSKLTFSIVTSLIAVFIGINFIHTFNFKDRITFWKNAVKYSYHHPLSHKNLGAMYFFNNNFSEAEVEYKKSLELNPYETMSHNNLGVIYLNAKEYDKAEAEFMKEQEINPNYDNTLANLGLLNYTKGNMKEAEKYWLMTLQVNPDHISTLTSLLKFYYNNKDEVRARYYYNELLKRGVKL